MVTVDMKGLLLRLNNYCTNALQSAAGLCVSITHYEITVEHFLLKLLEETACRCWKIFGLRGYARVDFRVDAAHRPWVLEINANPCISPDAGFSVPTHRDIIRAGREPRQAVCVLEACELAFARVSGPNRLPPALPGYRAQERRRPCANKSSSKPILPD